MINRYWWLYILLYNVRKQDPDKLQSAKKLYTHTDEMDHALVFGFRD